MRGVNKVIIIGNATRDAELRHTKSGKPVSNLRIAVNRQTGGEEHTQFFTVVCWEGLAETTAQYVKKGRLLYVEGRLEQRTFTDDEGKDRGADGNCRDDEHDQPTFSGKPHGGISAGKRTKATTHGRSRRSRAQYAGGDNCQDLFNEKIALLLKLHDLTIRMDEIARDRRQRCTKERRIRGFGWDVIASGSLR